MYIYLLGYWGPPVLLVYSYAVLCTNTKIKFPIQIYSFYIQSLCAIMDLKASAGIIWICDGPNVLKVVSIYPSRTPGPSWWSQLFWRSGSTTAQRSGMDAFFVHVSLHFKFQIRHKRTVWYFPCPKLPFTISWLHRISWTTLRCVLRFCKGRFFFIRWTFIATVWVTVAPTNFICLSVCVCVSRFYSL